MISIAPFADFVTLPSFFSCVWYRFAQFLRWRDEYATSDNQIEIMSSNGLSALFSFFTFLLNTIYVYMVRCCSFFFFFTVHRLALWYWICTRSNAHFYSIFVSAATTMNMTNRMYTCSVCARLLHETQEKRIEMPGWHEKYKQNQNKALVCKDKIQTNDQNNVHQKAYKIHNSEKKLRSEMAIEFSAALSAVIESNFRIISALAAVKQYYLVSKIEFDAIWFFGVFHSQS